MVRRALTDLRDVCYALAEHWGYKRLWDGRATAAPRPLELSDVPADLVKRLDKLVKRLGAALPPRDALPTDRTSVAEAKRGAVPPAAFRTCPSEQETAVSSNPLHALIERLEQYTHAVWQCHHASTNMRIDRAKSEGIEDPEEIFTYVQTRDATLLHGSKKGKAFISVKSMMIAYENAKKSPGESR